MKHTVHDLKTWPSYFEAVRDGSKTFEVRQDDRAYKVGDLLLLREYSVERHDYTGRALRAEVGFILRDFFGVEAGYVVLSLRNVRNQVVA